MSFFQIITILFAIDAVVIHFYSKKRDRVQKNLMFTVDETKIKSRSCCCPFEMLIEMANCKLLLLLLLLLKSDSDRPLKCYF